MIEQPHKKLARQLSQITLKFIEKRPLLVWGSALVLMLSVASTASTRLMSPGPVELEVIEAPALPKPQEQEHEVASLPAEAESRQNNTRMLLLLLGAIAVSCASASWLISKKLLYLHQQQQLSKTPMLKHRDGRSRRRKKVVGRSPQPAILKHPNQLPIQREKVVTRPPQPLHQPLQHTPVAIEVEQKIPAMPEPMVTVVPAEEFHPLDWGKHNLAEMMDIRKKHSLSSVMRN